MALPLNLEPRRLACRLPAVLAACAAAGVLSSGSALAVSSAHEQNLEATESYLQQAQNSDGGFAGEPGGASDPDISVWAALGLAAAGINPQSQAKTGGASVYSYLAAHAPELTSTNEFDRELLVVDASGTNPHDFGGIDLVGELMARRLSGVDREGAFTESAGGSTPSVNDTIFAVLALSPIDELAVQEAVRQAATWLTDVQNANGGGWPSSTVCPAHASPTGVCENDVDMTGAAIEALYAAGSSDTEAQTKAFAYLRSAQDASGGFPEQAGEKEANVPSTAWAVQAIWSAGENPELWVTSGGEPTDEPLGYLASMQQTDGHLRYRASEESNGVLVTGQGAPALAGDSYPIPIQPLSSHPPTTQSGSTTATQSATGSAEAGAGGESAQPGAGVITGGGGKGAPLFSRPQPQSQGSTRDGVRLLDATKARVAQRSNAKAARKADAERAAAAAASTPLTITAESSKTSADGHGTGSATASAGSGSGSGSAGQEVRGELISATSGSRDQALEPGAPGLRSAGAGGSQTPWLAIAIGALIGLLVLAGSQLERRRPQVIL